MCMGCLRKFFDVQYCKSRIRNGFTKNGFVHLFCTIGLRFCLPPRFGDSDGNRQIF